MKRSPIILAIIFIIAKISLSEIIQIPGDKATIQSGITAAVDGDTVLVDEGTYSECINFQGKAITVASHFILDQETSHIAKTIIYGNSGSVVRFLSEEDSLSILSGFTITNGSGISDPREMFSGSFVGGGICIYNASPKVSQCRIIKNAGSTYGGGIFCANSSSIFENLTISNNKDTYCGAGFYCYEASPKLIDVSIFDNHCEYNGELRGEGGGIYSERSYPELLNVRIYNNSATDGGGIRGVNNELVYLSGVSVYENRALLHGGISGGGSVFHYDSNNLCSVYLNEAAWIADMICYNSTVYLDTFTVLKPTKYFVSEYSNFMYIKNAKRQKVNHDLYVSVDGDNSNSGLNPTEPLHSVSFALELIEADSLNPCTIYLANGTYSSVSNFEQFPVRLKSNTFLSGESKENVIMKANSNHNSYSFSGRALECENIKGSKIENITITESWGGIVLSLSKLELKNLLIHKNGEHGISSVESEINLVNIVLKDNFAEGYSNCGWVCYYYPGKGGAIYAESSILNMDNVIIENNRALSGLNSLGGGLYCLDSKINLSDATIKNNYSGGLGGGIYAERSDLFFDPDNRSSIYSNQARQGNDIYSNDENFIEMLLDTFSVDKLTHYYAFPARNYSFETKHSLKQLTSADYFINPDGNDENDGLSAASPFLTINHAMARMFTDSLNEHTIHLSRGTYGFETTGDSIPIYLNDYVNIRGESQSQTIIDAGAILSVMLINQNQSNSISDITLTNADHSGINCQNSNINIENTTLLRNSAYPFAGGISLMNAHSTLNKVLIAENKSFGFDPMNWVITGSGSAIYSEYSSNFLNHVTIAKNIAEGKGNCSSIESHHSKFQIVNSILWHNIPGKVFADSSDLLIANSIIENGKDSIQFTGDGELFFLDGNLDMDPVFRDTSTSNYYLSHTSPGIDKAVSDILLYYNDGMDSIYIPQTSYFGMAPDLGAFEYDPSGKINAVFVPPESFSLNQNYPNPFNPTTTIGYHLPLASQVELSIYNILGQKVATLVSAKQPGGSYKVEWDASEFASGVYLYRLATDKGFVQTKKLILLK